MLIAILVIAIVSLVVSLTALVEVLRIAQSMDDLLIAKRAILELFRTNSICGAQAAISQGALTKTFLEVDDRQQRRIEALGQQIQAAHNELKELIEDGKA